MNRAMAIAVGVIAAASTALLPSTAVAAANANASWAGSPYSRSECQLMLSPGTGRPSLYCTRTYTETAEIEGTAYVGDDTCESGYRVLSVTGTLETLWRVWDLYDGPAPLAKFNVAGNEAPVSETWVRRAETDLGCGPDLR